MTSRPGLPAETPPVAAQPRTSDRHDLHAARVATGLLVPGVILLIALGPSLLMYAVFGSFAGIYGRAEHPYERARHQVHAAGMVVTGVAVGTVLAATRAPAGLVVGCVITFATVGSLATETLRVRPGGPFFGIVALGASATAPPQAGGPVGAVLICAGTSAFCIGFGLVLPLLGALARSGSRRGRVELGAPERTPTSFPGAPALRQGLRYALATGAAGGLGLVLGVVHANWAMAGAAVPLAVVTSGTDRHLPAVLRRAGHRVVGTALGLGVTGALLWPDPSPTVIAVAVMALIFPTELFMSRHHGTALGFFTPLIVLMTTLDAPAAPTTLLLDRAVDTAIGVLAGVTAAAVVPEPRPAAAPRHRARLGRFRGARPARARRAGPADPGGQSGA